MISHLKEPFHMSKQDRSLFLSNIKKSFAGSLNTRALVAIVVFGMIIAVFVLSDLSGRAGGKGGNLGNGAAATVNGQIISIKQFQDQETRISNYYAQLFGGQFDKMFQKKQLMAEAMNELVNNAVAEQAAAKESVYATDAEIRQAILEIPAFKKDGVFQSDLYKNLLNANRLTPGEFESSLRQQVSLQKVRSLFDAGYKPMTLEKNIESELKASQINIQYVKLNFESFNTAAVVSDADVNTQLANADFKKKVQDYYTKNAAEFETAEQVKASHILIKADLNDVAATGKAKIKAEELLRQIAKSDFGKLAAANSDDPGSKAKNGDLGYFSKGRMVPEFEAVAFKLKKGEVSGLVKSAFGFHIIKVTDHKPAEKMSESAAFAKIGRKQIAEEKYLNISKELESQVSKNSADVESFLAKNKLTWSESGYFDLLSETVPQINSSSVFKASVELTKQNPYAKNLIREGDSQYLIKLKDLKKIQSASAVEQMDQAAKQKSFGGYQKWVDSYKKQAKIETNGQLLQSAQE
jgi:peptidyl-prolyl cis-trans isomerase D